MEDWIEQYGSHLKLERNVSPHTLRNYLSDLKQFEGFLREKGLCVDQAKKIKFEDVDVHVVRAYLAFLSKGRRKSSIGRKLAALKGFFRYLVREKHVSRDPLAFISTPKQEKPLPKFLTVDDVFRLLGGIQGKGTLEMRDRAVLEVLYSTGVRVSELVGLNWGDIDFRLGIVRVFGKESKERIVPIGEIALQTLRDYGDEQTKQWKQTAKGDAPVF